MIIPRPQNEQYEAGSLTLSDKIKVTLLPEDSERIMGVFHLFFPMLEATVEDGGIIFFERKPFEKDEAYDLQINSKGITIGYKDFLGARNALATLAQLLTVKRKKLSLPFCHIEDYPATRVRSFMIDLGRGVGRKEELKETVLRLALLKYNQIHLHLVDSEGVAWQSNRYPKLTGPQNDQHSMQYFKSLNRLCVRLGLEVVPEIEVPAHNETILRCYPSWACEVDEETHPAKWALCVGNEEIFTFYRNIIEEVIEMFPDSTYIHIGGDEVNFADKPETRAHWEDCPRCRALGYSGLQEIFYYVIKRVYDIVKSYGKEVAMWNDWIDIAKPSPLPKDILIYFWRVAYKGRGPTEGCSMQGFLEQGYKVINAHYVETYLSSKGDATPEGIKDWAPTKRPETAPQYHEAILGGEVCAWEYGNEERYRFYRFTLPAPTGMLADRMWNPTVCEFDGEYEKALTRAVLGYKCPTDLNVYALIGTIMLEAKTEELGILNERTPSNKELRKAMMAMLPITVSDEYGHFAALYYTECLNWIITHR